ncbi:MAG: retroviral-like aspartic protease family protein, partial [Gammaproteobacteria bacterium]|nr:retroviral-like aspartic protease family protein [Gammaproteobacteria bacterium]
MLTVSMQVSGQVARALIDTGCTLTLVSSKLARGLHRQNDRVTLAMMDSSQICTQGSVLLKSVRVDGRELGPVRAQVLGIPPSGVDLVLGLDVIMRHGLVVGCEYGSAKVWFGSAKPCGDQDDLDRQRDEPVAVQAVVREGQRLHELGADDFGAWFEGGHWTAEWRWDGAPPVGRTRRHNYKVPVEVQDEFDKEVQAWVDAGYLVPWNAQKHGKIKNIVPLMCVLQQKGTASKVRPVLDFRWLNEHVKSRPGSAMPLCQDRLREWRKQGEKCAVVDLKKAYLQVRVAPKLWTYQAVWWNGQMHVLTRLGFGLNVAPKVMTAIVEVVLGWDSRISQAATSYIDDVLVNESVVSADKVVKLLHSGGLEAKVPERLGARDGVRVLGLRVNENMRWGRDIALPEVDGQQYTRREVHQLVGEWVGHLPVSSWLRVACGFLQRCTARDNVGWDEPVNNATLSKVQDVAKRLKLDGDPARGQWCVCSNGEAVLWVDASSLAIGVALEVDGNIVEDAAWLRSCKDVTHINLAELEAAIRGINLARKWGFRKMRLNTDSATAHGWLKAVFEATHNVRTKAMCELLIRRRLEILRQLKAQEQLQIEVRLVRSADNLADALTRVPRRWLDGETKDEVATGAASGPESLWQRVERIHGQHHFGVSRTLELARARLGEGVTRQIVKQ